MSIVSNTSPILNLSAIGEIALVERLFGKLLAPTAVELEIQRLQASNNRFSCVLMPTFVTILPVQNTPLSTVLKLQLHPGEAEALALAVEQQAACLLVDEHRARVVAARLGVPTLGCLGILLRAKKRGLIPAVRPLLEKLETQAGFWIGDTLRLRFLAAADE